MKKFAYPPSLFPFQSRWVNLSGRKVHYIDEGKSEVLLFCHPPVASSFMYRRIIRALSPDFRCIALDFPGFGMSEGGNAQENSIDSWAKLLEAFIDRAGIPPFYLVMQEIGGHAAMQVLLDRPELLKGIVLTDTIIFPCSDYPRITKMLSFVNSGLFRFLNGRFNLLVRAMSRFGFGKGALSKEERRVYRAMFAGREQRKAMTFMLYELVRNEKLLKRIQGSFSGVFRNVPALLIYGEKDPLARMRIPQRTQQLIAGSELHWIPGEGHFPHEGAAETMAGHIREWLKARTRNSTSASAVSPETSSPDSKPRSGQKPA